MANGLGKFPMVFLVLIFVDYARAVRHIVGAWRTKRAALRLVIIWDQMTACDARGRAFRGAFAAIGI